MNKDQINAISKFLSLVLRHDPGKIDLELDEQGWADTGQLLKKMAAYKEGVNRELLEEVVVTNDKKRFAFNEDKTKIRASQGHSVAVMLGLEATAPPERLFHGTVEKFLSAIKAEGLQKMSRQQVHLSQGRETAERVGSRRGKPVILSVNAGQMHQEGIPFYRSENGVWLTEQVPAIYINF